MYRSTIIAVSLCVVLGFVSSGQAQVRTSPNYQLEQDSINVGGGLGQSANFRLEDTVGEVATGRATSTNFELRAGYQQLGEVFISITGAAPVTLTPAIPGITGGQSNGSTSLNVATNNNAGYQLTIQSSQDPAMRSAEGNAITNYVPSSGADFSFTVPAASARFGFSPEGSDIVNAFLDNSTSCGVGTSDTASACWAGVTAASQIVASAATANLPSGATTTLRFRVGVTSGAGVATGLYVATTTVTALPL
jgi:hypothetical protein